MTVRKGHETYRTRVEFVAKDAQEQIATGVAMVPDKVDLQLDFARPETIATFAEQFGDFYDVEQADGGVMHAAFPSEWMDLERNEVLDSEAEIGGKTVPAGGWVQEWRFNDADLWELVDDGVLSGLSIGAVNVQWNGPFEQDAEEVADVDTSEVPEDELIWELASGIIREVSAVDIPAVPDALILETKDAYEKRLADHLGNRDGFLEEAMQRGHSSTDAERLWDVLNRAVDVEGAGEPGKQSFFERVGKSVFDAIKGEEAASEPTHKAGQVLNAANIADEKAIMDAAASILESAGVDTEFTRFTDREDDSFDLTEHQARSLPDPEEGDEEEDEGGEEEESATPSGTSPMQTSAETETETQQETMSNETESGEDEKGLAEQNAEQIAELTDAVKALAESSGAEPEEPDPFEDAPEWAKELNEQLQKGGHRQYGGETSNGEEPESGMDALSKILS